MFTETGYFFKFNSNLVATGQARVNLVNFCKFFNKLYNRVQINCQRSAKRVQLNIWTKAARRFVMEIYKSFTEKSDRDFLRVPLNEKSGDEGF